MVVNVSFRTSRRGSEPKSKVKRSDGGVSLGILGGFGGGFFFFVVLWRGCFLCFQNVNKKLGKMVVERTTLFGFIPVLRWWEQL